jgi:hypothetical protein
VESEDNAAFVPGGGVWRILETLLRRVVRRWQEASGKLAHREDGIAFNDLAASAEAVA